HVNLSVLCVFSALVFSQLRRGVACLVPGTPVRSRHRPQMSHNQEGEGECRTPGSRPTRHRVPDVPHGWVLVGQRCKAPAKQSQAARRLLKWPPLQGPNRSGTQTPSCNLRIEVRYGAQENERTDKNVHKNQPP
uniref:Secreted protein n=1 Tax=Leptobrachium leishanense TaxID=445787 RepID=A0A8C5M8H2_9ANUR